MPDIDIIDWQETDSVAGVFLQYCQSALFQRQLLSGTLGSTINPEQGKWLKLSA
ncbi:MULTISPECIES: hypothetical protein [unclassified Erwinia]|uniref:hypothetical protein n=1 Tax=unclassified Erwinia TaxID=2622719 RepID=UPI000A4749EA|nr:hypothetical protein [Erwinia sp. ErVv1]